MALAAVVAGASSFSNSIPYEDIYSSPKAHIIQAEERHEIINSQPIEAALSRFERIVTSYPPIVESLIHQLPTPSLLDLYHTSRYLRSFLRSYPLAWGHLSFRLPAPAVVLGNPSLGTVTPDGRERQSKPYALDALLLQVVVPCGQRIKTLDLDNTAVSGITLVSRVLEPRRDTLQHLSVRGCKNVSIKYHILPYLQLQANLPAALCGDNKLALKSLYTYRCRHHRRRPYLPTSLMRRDSDSEPTHELIELCHELGIWTDTAWCPTPGPRCLRRKDYHSQRGAQGRAVVWVPFDRLWRSGNRIGPTEDSIQSKQFTQRPGLVWEEMETGHDGEPLGTKDGPTAGEGKELPAHLRRSHRIFIEDIRCDACGDEVLERCEQCSIRMHCMGCRKTLCASCAFNRPIARKTAKRRRLVTEDDSNSASGGFGESAGSSLTADFYTMTSRRVEKRSKFWWAPGAVRSPNIMNERSTEDVDSSDSEEEEHTSTTTQAGNSTQPAPKLTTHWCCLEPMFSGGGGIAFLGPNSGGKGVDRIRTSPLPKGLGFEDPAFSTPIFSSRAFREAKATLFLLLGRPPDVLPYLEQESTELQTATCPRSLCKKCYTTTMWKVPCTACKRPLCREHDFRALKVRKCGYRDLTAEREYVRDPPVVMETPSEWEIPEFKGVPTSPQEDTDNSTIASTTSEKLPTSHNSLALPKLPPLLSDISLPDIIAQQYSICPSLETPLKSSSTTHPAPFLLPFTPSSSRHRSLSASAASGPSTSHLPSSSTKPPRDPHLHRIRDPLSNHAHLESERIQQQKRLPLPCSVGHPVQWHGCGAYFCLQTRPVGDSRPRCESGMRECQGCGVWVCETCQSHQPSPSSTCPCTHCSSPSAPFHCPVCVKLPTVRALCKRAEEEKARLEREEKERVERVRREWERREADRIAEMSWQFWEGVQEDGGVGSSVSEGALKTEVPVCPDCGVEERDDTLCVMTGDPDGARELVCWRQ